MNVSPLLDLLLVVLLLGYVIYGLAIGLTRSVFVIAGIAAGVIAAVLLAPTLASAVPSPQVRVVVTMLAAIALIAIGHAIGAAIARALRDELATSKLRGIDRAAGGLAIGVLAALVVSTVSFSAAQLGSPLLSRSIAGSSVIRTIQEVTPDVVEERIAQLRTVLADQAVPLFTSGLTVADSTVPAIDTESPALAAAAESVVRITGNAYACGQSHTGTGFIVSEERVVTNAHVVAGTERPVIEALNGQVLSGTIVYFDAEDDLAVIAVPGLSPDPLRLGITARPGTNTAIEGYPHGGPISVEAALVQHVSTANSPNIYGSGSSPREVYTLAGQVNPGNSGGPLLTLDGDVVGAVFARSADQANVGYAMTLTELQPVADQAPTLTSAVSSGACIPG
ncbi:MarP family serine protease [Salinibacterium sp. M195]|uniref:MarP family serine protease n=1 Tax=Salinibacterium sp. M195 TaxID=2583374 RepID=UPI001C63599B|nr:MarP family serine protease [Salinibacterium sp. M195]QYH36485.1 MarP family serine protease [Salinibacterium sp. M195]